MPPKDLEKIEGNIATTPTGARVDLTTGALLSPPTIDAISGKDLEPAKPLIVSPTPSLSPVDVSSLPPATTQVPEPTPPSITSTEDLMNQLEGKNVAGEVSTQTEQQKRALNEINLQIQMHQKRAMQAEEAALQRGETLEFASGEAARVRRESAFKALELSALAQAAQGNLSLAAELATNAVNEKYKKAENDLKKKRNDIIANYENFTPAQKKQADAVLLRIDANDAFIKEKKKNENDLKTIGNTAAANGAPVDLVNKALATGDTVKANAMLAPYVGTRTNQIGTGGLDMENSSPSKIAEAIMQPNSGLNLNDVPIKNRAAVSVELNKRKAEALKTGDIDGIIKASSGGKPVSDTFTTSFEKSVNVLAQIGELQQVIQKEATGPIWGVIRSRNPFDQKAREIKSRLQAIVPNLARGVYGEVGVLTDNDIALYSQTLPNLTSQEELRGVLLGIAVRSIQRSLENKIKTQAGLGRDVSGIGNFYDEIKGEADRLLGGELGQTNQEKIGDLPDLIGLDFRF